MHIADVLSNRWKPRWTTRHAARKSTLDNALQLMKAPAFHLTEIREAAQGRLTEKGVREQYRERMATPNILGRLNKDRAEIKSAREELAAKRAALGTPKFDSADTLGAAHRREARDLFRSLSPTEQAALLFGSLDGKVKPDPEFQAAVLERSAKFSGLPADRYAQARDVYVRTNFAPQLAELDEASDVLDLVEASLKTAIYTIQADSGLDEHEANTWVDGVAPF